VNPKITAEERMAELTTAYDAVVALLHSSFLSSDSRKTAESLLAVLAEDMNRLRAEQADAATAG
jgi:hypothetical protein